MEQGATARTGVGVQHQGRVDAARDRAPRLDFSHHGMAALDAAVLRDHEPVVGLPHSGSTQ